MNPLGGKKRKFQRLQTNAWVFRGRSKWRYAGSYYKARDLLAKKPLRGQQAKRKQRGRKRLVRRLLLWADVVLAKEGEKTSVKQVARAFRQRFSAAGVYTPSFLVIPKGGLPITPRSEHGLAFLFAELQATFTEDS